ncbi:hypothetical protein IMZ08_14275 [Bacillus luteolus]|uniref:DUF308 domain-containing protein n=1 Tax=Litchfieldia luteola TaxID=682179 RepID=A0ABR9QL53_9BACI|nr:hypothetical protein [Cytobacillus luteolus]MBE4909229.1 hypothetical protein [Cytobacillus luteolus]MBP1940314.1 hypothetical protein [Cytobacillus luteolus]
MDLQSLKREYALSTNKGIAMFYGGMLIWLILGLVSFVLPKELNAYIYLGATGVFFPVGILVSKVLKIDFFAKNNPLSTLGGLLGALQLFFAPLLIMVGFQHYEWVPFVVGVLTGAHFLPFMWLYDSKAMLFQTIVTVLVSTLVGLLFIESALTLVPFSLMLVYFITAMLIRKEVATLKIQAEPSIAG